MNVENMNTSEVIDIASDSNSTVSNNDYISECQNSLPFNYFGVDSDEDRPAIDYDRPVEDLQTDFLCKYISDCESSDETLAYASSPTSPSPGECNDVAMRDKTPNFVSSTNFPSQEEHGVAKSRSTGDVRHTENKRKKGRSSQEGGEKKVKRHEQVMEKKLALMNEKALKAAAAEKQRLLKPEESLKLMKVHISNEIINSSYGGAVISALQGAEIEFIVEPCKHPCTLHWTKKEVLSGGGEVDQGWLLVLMPWQKAVQLIHTKALNTYLLNMQDTSALNQKLLLIIFGIDKYFSYQKLKHNRAAKDKIQGTQSKTKASEKEYATSPTITQDDMELVLTESQLMGNYSHRLIETAEDLAMLVVQLTKSMAQIEFKQHKAKAEQEALDWYAKADSKDCVKVDKKGIGLAKLWQQQLCQFPGVGIETAQAITSQYASPTVLWDAYNECSDAQQTEVLLENIPVRRNASVLSSTRKVGPELSRKVARYFTSLDKDEVL